MESLEVQHYRAPCNVAEHGITCHFCGLPISPDDIIVDVNDQEVAHESCAQPEEDE